MKKKRKIYSNKISTLYENKNVLFKSKKKFSDEFELAWIRFSKLINLLGKKYAEVILAAVSLTDSLLHNGSKTRCHWYFGELNYLH